MGLAEGEDGCKDVSDQIQSQDQLEDAKKNYDDQTEQDKNIKVQNNLLIYVNIYKKKKKYCSQVV